MDTRFQTAVDHEHDLTDLAWRLRGATARIMECRINEEHGAGFHVRVHDDLGGLVHACRVGTLRKAKLKATEWRHTLLSLSEYEDHSSPR
jgi:hypothetical protein